MSESGSDLFDEAPRPAGTSELAQPPDTTGAPNTAGAVDPGDPAEAAEGGTRPIRPRDLRDRVRRRLAALKRDAVHQVRVRVVTWDTVEVSLLGGVRSRRYRLDDPRARRTVNAPVLRIDAPDPASFDRLAGAQLLRGGVRELRVHIDRAPQWLRTGLALPAVSAQTVAMTWRARGAGIEVRLAWRRRRPVARALGEVAAAVVRTGRWDQSGGPVHALDRAGWLQGTSTWPQGVAGVTPTYGGLDADGRPAASPFTPLPKGHARDTGGLRWPLGIGVANPYRRRLLGEARRLTLAAEGRTLVLRKDDGAAYLRFDVSTPAERTLLSRHWDKYSVVDVGTALPSGQHSGRSSRAFLAHVLRALGACGVVFASAMPQVRAELADLGLVAVADPAQVRDLAGYQLSAAASRRATIDGDLALRHTALAGGTLPLPTVSVLVATMRPDDIARCLAGLAAQTYPAFEVVVGTHGYALDDAQIAALAGGVPRVRFVPVDSGRTLGEVLGTLARHADGEVVTKVDDDDHYGPDHLTDLVLAWRSSGAELVAKSARFVHFADVDKTVDRTWAAMEAYDVTPAGGTFLLSSSTLRSVGGWSTSPRHVDADLLWRLRAAGGACYRTHGLGYVYVRRSSGHTFQADTAELFAQGGSVWDAIPAQILRADEADEGSRS